MSDLGFAGLDLLGVARGGYAVAALVHGLFAIYLLFAWRSGRAGAVLAGALVAGALWSVAALASLSGSIPLGAQLAGGVDVLRIGAWYAFVLVLMSNAGTSQRSVRMLTGIGAAVLLAQLACHVAAAAISEESASLGRSLMMASLLAAIFGLVLLEQLYRSLPIDGRWGLKPLALALAAAFGFDLYLFAEGLLFRQLDPAVWSVRGLVHAMVLPLVALSVARNPTWKIRISVSRQVVFHTSALLISGAYLLLVAGAGYYLRFFGGDWGRAFQVAILFAGLVGLVAVVVSGSLRARLRVWLSKNLFAYRYDYRSEWLGFTQALAVASDRRSPGEAVIKALADLVESPGGGIWLLDDAGSYSMQGRLNMPQSDAVEERGGPLASFLSERGWVVNLEEFRSRRALYEGLSLPEWVSRLQDAWLIIPLTAAGSFNGFVVLLAPRTPFEVDWEVLDLLKTAQQQAASYLSQLASHEALLEASKFDSFNRMSAFVVHDLKNLVAQLSLLMKNAERHRDNPEFQSDMLETVAHVESRMRVLMGQLIEKTSIDPRRPVDVAALMARIVSSRGAQTPQPVLLECESVMVMAHADRLERILGHIVQNAIDATDQDGKVSVRVIKSDSGRVQICVSDTGCGMSQEFIRDGLFKPFRSTKESGMGIGAYETRQYVREIGGTVGVESEAGVGTQISVSLPACELGDEAEPRELGTTSG